MQDSSHTIRSGATGTRDVASETLANLAGGAEKYAISRAMRSGLWIWPSFTALDVYMCFVAFPGAPFGLFIVYRILIELLFFVFYRATLPETADAKRLFPWLVLCFFAAAFTVSLMAIHLGGIVSPYMHGISLIALVWAALVPTHWRRGLATFVLVGMAFPLVMGVGAAVSPALRAEWMGRRELIDFASNYVFVVSSCTLGVILSHQVWSAQQQARKVGSYQLEELLGRGGMGEVWRARHYLLARRAAIKLIRPEKLGGDVTARRVVLTRFEREAQATALLRSPHTIHLYDFGISDTGAFYYVMELLVGRDMESLVREFGAQPAERVLYLIEQVCESLSEAHATGLVHRDIKPSNLHVCRVGLHYDFVKVLDFGLAKDRRPDSMNETLAAIDTATGTPAYMAPEIILGESDVDRRADIYALGCVAYYLLTGELVFEAETSMKTMVRHVKDTPVPPSQRTELSVPAALDDLILKCLEKERAKRPQDAQEVLQMAKKIRRDGAWEQEQARAWWEKHLPELCGP
jgi:tRNA A-37 threonylcarbamoyl transferase component Bud32